MIMVLVHPLVSLLTVTTRKIEWEGSYTPSTMIYDELEWDSAVLHLYLASVLLAGTTFRTVGLSITSDNMGKMQPTNCLDRNYSGAFQ